MKDKLLPLLISVRDGNRTCLLAFYFVFRPLSIILHSKKRFRL